MTPCRACGIEADNMIPIAFRDVRLCRPCWKRFVAWLEAESGRPLNEPEDLAL